MELIIKRTLQIIKEQTGISLKIDDYFSGIRTNKGKKYFNVLLDSPIWMSIEYDRLYAFADKYKNISVEPNGDKRVAIFINEDI